MIAGRAVKSAANLLEMTPRRVRPWEEGEDGRVRVLVPRYGDHPPGRWLSRALSREPIRVRLDETGSLVWKACDGRRTVTEIAASLSGPAAEGDDLHERLARYFRELEVSRFIRWD